MAPVRLVQAKFVKGIAARHIVLQNPDMFARHFIFSFFLLISITVPGADKEAFERVLALEDKRRDLISEKKFESAAEVSKQIVGLAKRSFGGNNFFVVQAYETLGSDYLQINQPENAEKAYLEAVKIGKSSGGSRDPLISTMALGLAKAYLAQGKRELAVSIHIEVVNINENSFDPFSKELVLIHGQIGDNHEAYGSLADAAASYSKALSLAVSTTSPESKMARAKIMGKLGCVLELQEKPKEAIKYLSKGLELITENLLAFEFLQFQFLIPLSELYARVGDYENAELCYRRLQSKWEYIADEQSTYVAAILDKRADIHQAQGNSDKANQLRKQAAEARSAAAKFPELDFSMIPTGFGTRSKENASRSKK